MAGLVIAAILVIAVVAGSVTAWRASVLNAEVAREWDLQQQRSDSHGENITTILRHMGYGGFIHSFKNYVLRHDADLRDRLAHDLIDLHGAIDGLESSLTASSDIAALKDIEAVVAA